MADSRVFRISPAVRQALQEGRPVVALESTIISHGMPYPDNVKAALSVEAIVRAAGAVPATIGILDGRLIVGLDGAQIETLGRIGPAAVKASRRDLALLLADDSRQGATTVAATMIAAERAGIRVFVTGGLGGVHRDGHNSMDVSADLAELARTPTTVVCAGIKSILDI
ncbi:MAG: pseudouridine-5'-phosphate glycosidase, partial [archaeon]|nr:pseudouridine-5'-phosphate glycosidase [archaeon]